jgi:hypothetical protein
LALLEAVRRHADRISIFCQTGRIAVPRWGQTLLLHLEGSVLEVTARREGGIFHPKLWVLRYISPDGPVHYRVICLTRNLTFDRSWDTALVLDGVLEERKNAFSANHPLGDFIAAMPELTVRPAPASVRGDVARIADEIRRVRFELPEGFEEYAFWPLGLDRRRQLPFPRTRQGRRMMVVSPFLSTGFLERVSAERPEGKLVSRPESLAELDAAVLERFDEVLVLSPDADPDDIDEGQSEGDEAGEGLTGLHAKLFVMDDGWRGRVWTGSANATDAAFSQNVEFLVELSGKKSICGIDAFLGDEGGSGASLRDLLEEFRPAEEEQPTETVERKLEWLLDEARLSLGRAGLRAVVTEAGDGETFHLDVRRGRAKVRLPTGVEADCRPVSLRSDWARPLETATPSVARFERLAFEALTGFFAVDLVAREDGDEATAAFVLNLPLEGAPEDRRQRLLQAILKDSRQVLRLIWLLLSEADLSVQDWIGAGLRQGSWREGRRPGGGGFPLLETMLRALDRDPTKLDEVARLIADLQRTPEGAALLPAELDAIWAPVQAVREELDR